MPLERRWLAGAVGRGRLAVEVSGIGATGARRAARRLADLGVDALASWGMAAGLDPRLEAGVVVVPTRLIGSPEHTFPPDRAWRQRLLGRLTGRVTVCGDPLVDTPTVLETAAAKAAIFERTGAAAADMESAAVAQVAAERGLPFVAVRVILDPAGLALPRGLGRAVDDRGRVQPAQVLIRCLLDPLGWPRWAVLVHGFLAARRAMRTVAELSAPDLALSGR